MGYSIWKGVQLLAKESDGRLYLLAANSAFDPAEVTWSGFDPEAVSALRVLSEERQVRVRDGAAADWFEPYGIHVYALT